MVAHSRRTRATGVEHEKRKMDEVTDSVFFAWVNDNGLLTHRPVLPCRENECCRVEGSSSTRLVRW
jgi:hypothetical protein